MLDAEDFSFEDDTHTYRQGGMVRPSATQILKLCGVISYAGIPAKTLEAARLRGDLVHVITAERDRTGVMPLDWATADCIPRLEAYEQFLHDHRGRIEWREIEEPMVCQVAGMWVGGTPDRICLIDDRPWVIDLKNASAFQPGWKLQLAIYEMMHSGISACGQAGRMVLQLLPTGKYRKVVCDNASDGAAAIGLLSVATWMQQENLFKPAKTE